MSWFYGLVKEKNGKIRVWEIFEEQKYLWGHRAVISWTLRDTIIFIKDILNQRKYIKHLFSSEKLEKGNKRIVKKWNRETKKTIKRLEIKQ